ncbi:MAG TPA: Uma2 family endonuclease [Candidatus Acidoferrales bacterium]|nr:Uma2 family endonuclease [Candidatus Acidoferrales bacterium]
MSLSESTIPRHRITVDEYYRMAEVGILAPEARVELIEGEIIDMTPIGTRHMGVVDCLNRILTVAVGERAIVRIQGPVRLDNRSEPEPDIALLKPRGDFYRDKHPTAEDILLIIDVSDTMVAYDRSVKIPLYARHGLPEVWLIDLQAGRVHVHRSPQNGVYTDISTRDRSSVVTLLLLPDISIDFGAIL